MSAVLPPEPWMAEAKSSPARVPPAVDRSSAAADGFGFLDEGTFSVEMAAGPRGSPSCCQDCANGLSWDENGAGKAIAEQANAPSRVPELGQALLRCAPNAMRGCRRVGGEAARSVVPFRAPPRDAERNDARRSRAEDWGSAPAPEVFGGMAPVSDV